MYINIILIISYNIYNKKEMPKVVTAHSQFAARVFRSVFPLLISSRRAVLSEVCDGMVSFVDMEAGLLDLGGLYIDETEAGLSRLGRGGGGGFVFTMALGTSTSPGLE